MTLKTTIERCTCEIEINVDYTYSKGSRGHRDKYGAPEEPDDDPDIEIESITDRGGKEIDLTKKELEAVTLECWEHLGEPE